MAEIIPIALVLVFGLLTAVWMQSDLEWREAKWFWMSLVAHLVSMAVLIVQNLNTTTGSDVLNYVRFGQLLADDLRRDFWGVFPLTISAFLHLPSNLNMPMFGAKTTNSMSILTGWVAFMVNNSLVATSAVFMFASLFGKLALYRGLRTGFPSALFDRVAWAVFLVPSFVFWTSGIVKESVAMVGVGMLMLALGRLSSQRTFVEVARAVLSALLISLVKPYLLFVFTGAVAVWLYYQRSVRDGTVIQFRPLQVATISIVGLLTILALGQIFPQFALGQIAEEAATRQTYVLKSHAKSSYFIGDPSRLSLWGQAAFAPLGVFTAWYRPLIFEVRSAPALVSSLEGALFIVGSILIIVRGRPMVLWQALSRWPWLAFCISFAVAFGAIVGMVSGNFGTLVRYRVPLMPFLALALLILSMPPAQLLALMAENLLRSAEPPAQIQRRNSP